MSKSALTVLREARELISDPKRWTQGAFAKDEDGEPRLVADSRAICWCSEGALYVVAHDPYQLSSAYDFLSNVAKGMVPLNERPDFSNRVVYVNDELGHEAALRMFDTAIASAEKEAQV